MVSLAFRLVDAVGSGSFGSLPVDDYCERWSQDHEIPIEDIHAQLRKTMAAIHCLKSNPDKLRQLQQEGIK